MQVYKIIVKDSLLRKIYTSYKSLYSVLNKYNLFNKGLNQFIKEKIVFLPKTERTKTKIFNSLEFAKIFLKNFPPTEILLNTILLYSLNECSYYNTIVKTLSLFNENKICQILLKIKKKYLEVIDLKDNQQQNIDLYECLFFNEDTLKLGLVLFSMYILNPNNNSPNYQKYLCHLATNIFVPIMSIAGLNGLATKVEDYCMKIRNKKAYIDMVKLDYIRLKKIRKIFIENFKEELFEKISRYIKNKFFIINRTKGMQSSYNKIKKQNIDPNYLYDYLGITIIVDTAKQNENEICYLIGNIIKKFYKIDIKKTRDWIKKPKETGYKAFHLTILYKDCILIEIQIKSIGMRNLAEFGLAAHWRYKDRNFLLNEKQNVIINKLRKDRIV